MAAEKAFRRQCPHKMHHCSFYNEYTVIRKVSLDVFKSVEMEDHTLNQTMLEDHRFELIKLILDSYVRIRLCYEAKVYSQPNDYHRRIYHKLIHFKESVAAKVPKKHDPIVCSTLLNFSSIACEKQLIS